MGTHVTNAAFGRFIELIRDGVEPGDGPSGRVSISTDEGDARLVEVDRRSVRLADPGERPDVDAAIRIEAAILDDVLDRLHSVDWREPAIGSRVRFEGDANLAS